MRTVAACLALTLTGACGNDTAIDLRNAFEGMLQSPSPDVAASRTELHSRLTPERLARIGAPVMIAELPGMGVSAVVVLAEQAERNMTWVAADGVSLTTYGGVLRATRGLGHDLMSADIEDALIRITAHGTGQARRSYRHLDGENHMSVTTVECSYARTPDQVGMRVTETCSGPRATFANQYFVNPDGGIIASRQWIGAHNGYLLLEGPIAPTR